MAAGFAIIEGPYRYRLDRLYPRAGLVAAIVMVNPSTANADEDDHTIRKLRGFAAHNGWARIVVGNLFAWRATDVRELGQADDPIGPKNDEYLATIFQDADVIVFAWGSKDKLPPRLRTRWRRVHRIAQDHSVAPVLAWGSARCGHPRHPLMLAYATPLVPWVPPL